MKTNTNRVALLATLVLAAALPAAFGITVTPNNNATTLANTINGGGITINSATYTGAAGAVGTFAGGLADGLGIDTGIVLTTGSAAIAGQTNNSGSAGLANGTAGTSYLDNLIPGYSTHDAAILTINFSTTGGDLYFNYVFGSEEYNEWVNTSYNDVFGFFVDGTAVGQNIALIPSTTTPVSINNVNLGSNSAYYKNNAPGPYGNIQYDGFTSVLTAKALGLGAGNHTITLAIADAGDYIYDSGVFIQGGTFSDTPTTVPDAGLTALLLGLSLSILGLVRRKR